MFRKYNNYFYAIVLAVAGIVFVSALVYSTRTSHDLIDTHTPLVDAAMEAKLELALANLEFEELISGDKTASMDVVNEHFNRATWYLNAMLTGAENSEETFIPLTDPALTGRFQGRSATRSKCFL